MKRLLVLIFALALLLLVGCGGEEKKTQPQANVNQALPNVKNPPGPSPQCQPGWCVSLGGRGRGTLYVSPTGSDATANKCDGPSTPCLTINAAYKRSICSGWIEVLPGDYAKQTISQDATKDTCNTEKVRITIYGQEFLNFGADPKLRGLTINGDNMNIYHLDGHNSACDGATIRDADCNPFVLSAAVNVRFSDSTGFARYYVYGGSNQSIENSDFGPSYDRHGIISSGATTLSVLGTALHDQTHGSACIATPGCIGDNHMNCLTFNGLSNSRFVGSKIYDCLVEGLLIKPCGGAVAGNNIDNILFENMWWGSAGTSAVNFSQCAGFSSSNIDFLFNTFQHQISVDAGVLYPGSEVFGSLGSFGGCTGLTNAGFVMDWNVSTGTACGPHSFSDEATLGLAVDEYHLLSSSPGRDKIPSSLYHPLGDIDNIYSGRPNGAAVDAGADEYVAP